MCGILGLVDLAGTGLAPWLEAARAATRALAHRGPDHQGEWTSGSVFLGHRRLSILDLSAAANQPFADPTGRHVLCYNGEVYNHGELRAELEAEGVCFRTRSDTEVVLAALIRWGEAALPRFDGMFAGIWHDKATGRTLAFRDPLGQKPLYWGQSGQILLMASELRAFMDLGASWDGLDRDAIRRFLARSYFAWDETPLRAVRKLPPGHLLRLEAGGMEIRRWWHSIPGRDMLDLDETEAVREFDRLFRRSCLQSMECDVPYGVFLSGGMDSSLVLDYCREAKPDVRAFSVAMAEADFDESAKAAQVARHLGIGAHSTFTMSENVVVDCLDAVLASSDEPHGDPGMINAYFLAKSCRPHLTVGLAGDGGDELFAGYAPFSGLRAAAMLDRCPGHILSLIKTGARLVPSSDRYLGLRFKLDNFLKGFPAQGGRRFALWLASQSEAEIQQLCRGFSHIDEGLGREMAAVTDASAVQQLLHFYQQLFLPEFVAMHTDRAAMQHALEVRSPFLSAPLITFANRLPDSLKRGPGGLKYLLKAVGAMRGLPASILKQRKQGFTFPVARWLKTSLSSRMRDLLQPGPWNDGLVEASEMARLQAEHLSGRANHYRILYNLMVLAAWRRRHPRLEIVR